MANALILASSTVGCNGKSKSSIILRLGNLALLRLDYLSVTSLAETFSVDFSLAEMPPVSLCLLTGESFNWAIRALILGLNVLDVPFESRSLLDRQDT
ncbi:MAG: hypothetical protein WCS57_03150 [Bacillota bacterium]